MATIEQGDGMNEYRFTRRGDGAYDVTTPAADGWRRLDGNVTTHDHGRVVCIDFSEPVDLDALQAAWRHWWEWWQREDGQR